MMHDLASPRARAVPSRTEIAARLATHPPLDTLLTADDLEKQQLAASRGLRPAAVLLLVVNHAEPTVVFTMRTAHLSDHAGQISFPGGRCDEGDCTPERTALREAHEEIGLESRYVARAGYLRDHVVISGFRVTPVVAFVAPGFDLRLDTTEVEDVFEVPLEYALDPANQVPRERHFAGLTIVTCDIRYHDRQIWGATASMLLTLSRLLRPGAA